MLHLGCNDGSGPPRTHPVRTSVCADGKNHIKWINRTQETVRAQECWPRKEGVAERKEISKDISQRYLWLTQTQLSFLLQWLTCKLLWSLWTVWRSVGLTMGWMHVWPVYGSSCFVVCRGAEGPLGGVCPQTLPWAGEGGEKPEKRGTDPSSYWGLEGGHRPGHRLLWCPRGVHRWLVGHKLKPGSTWDLQHQEVWSLGGGRTLPVSYGAPGRMGKGGWKEGETIVWDKTRKQGEINMLFTQSIIIILAVIILWLPSWKSLWKWYIS